MKSLYYSAAVVLALGAISGCNRLGKQPDMQNALITPSLLTPGDSAVITVEVKDKDQIIDRIEGVVKEDPRITFNLRDDGLDPDAEANDHVWSLKVDVPQAAPAGSFTLEFTAFRSDGTAVSVRDKGGNVMALTETIPVVIQYAGEGAAAMRPAAGGGTSVEAEAGEVSVTPPAAADARDDDGDDKEVVDSTPSDPTKP